VIWKHGDHRGDISEIQSLLGVERRDVLSIESEMAVADMQSIRLLTIKLSTTIFTIFRLLPFIPGVP
jgi:hypothetical protein